METFQKMILSFQKNYSLIVTKLFDLKAKYSEFFENLKEQITYNNKSGVHYFYDRINNYDSNKKVWLVGSAYVPIFDQSIKNDD